MDHVKNLITKVHEDCIMPNTSDTIHTISLLGILILSSCILCNVHHRVTRYYGTHMITNTTNTPNKPDSISNPSHHDNDGNQYQILPVCPLEKKCQMQGCHDVENNQCQIDENQLGLPRGHRLKNQYQTRRIYHCDTQNLIQQSHRLENEWQC